MPSLQDILSGLDPTNSNLAPPPAAQPNAQPESIQPLAPVTQGNVLATLQRRAQMNRPAPAQPTQPYAFSGVPDVKGMSKGAAFATGLSSGLHDSGTNSQLQSQQEQQNLALQLQIAKAQQDQQNTQFSQNLQTQQNARADMAQSLPYIKQKAEIEAAAAKSQEETGKEKATDAQGMADQLFPPNADGTRTPENLALAASVASGGKYTSANRSQDMTAPELKAYNDSTTRLSALQGSLQDMKTARDLAFPPVDPTTGQPTGKGIYRGPYAHAVVAVNDVTNGSPTAL